MDPLYICNFGPARDGLDGRWLYRSIAVVAVLTLCGVAEAAEDILPFVQKFKDRFPSEIKDRSAFEREYRGRIAVRPLAFDIEYDDAKGQVSVAPVVVDDTLIINRCTSTGSGVGVTGMGVRIKYYKQVCHRVLLNAEEDARLGREELDAQLQSLRDSDKAIQTALAGNLSEKDTQAAEAKLQENQDKRMTLSKTDAQPTQGLYSFKIQSGPDMYRAIKANGIEIETVIKARLSNAKPVAYNRIHTQAQLDEPFETDAHVYTVIGHVIERRYYLPGRKNALSIIRD